MTSLLPEHDLAAMEFAPEVMREMTHTVVERTIAHLASLAEQPSCGDVHDHDRLRALREAAPEHGTAIEPLLALLFDDLIPRSFTTTGPGYLAYIPGGGVYPAALADYISDATNRYTGIWMAAPALVQLEANVLEWLRDWMGFPTGTAGLLTTGGSGATFNAIAAAREQKLGTDIRVGTLYTSSQGHHCINKAAKLAGIAADRVRSIPVDQQFRMDVQALANAIAADRAQGLTPFFVASSAGTTNTGAVDPLDDIADLCAREGLWHHVDGAYGAFFHMCPELRSLLSGLSRADSLTLDPHKGMFLPYGTGALLVRDGEALRALHSATAGYLPENQGDFYDPAQYGPELSRGFPGLRVWLSCEDVWRGPLSCRDRRETGTGVVGRGAGRGHPRCRDGRSAAVIPLCLPLGRAIAIHAGPAKRGHRGADQARHGAGTRVLVGLYGRWTVPRAGVRAELPHAPRGDRGGGPAARRGSEGARCRLLGDPNCARVVNRRPEDSSGRRSAFCPLLRRLRLPSVSPRPTLSLLARH